MPDVDGKLTEAEKQAKQLDRIEAKVDRCLRGLALLVEKLVPADQQPRPKHRTAPAIVAKAPRPPAPPPVTRPLPEPRPERGDAWEGDDPPANGPADVGFPAAR